MKRILFISTRSPYSGRYSGDVLRSQKIINLLEKNYNLDICCLSKEKVNIKKTNLTVFNYPNFFLKILFCLISFIRFRPIHFGLFYSNEMNLFIQNNANNYDYLFFYHIRSSQYLPKNYHGKTIIEMDKETGISIMKIISKLDAGPYMLQEKIKIDKKDNYSTLSKKLSILGSKLIKKSLQLIEKKNDVYVDQDESKVTYAKKILKQETEISWNLTAKQLVAKINGLNPSPGAWFRYKGNRLKIIEAIEVESSGEPGKVLEGELIIACRKNAIKVLFIQKEGKKVLNTKDFLAGHKINIGEKLT